MTKFTIKFLIAAALFFIPALVFQVYVRNNTSGDLGALGMIPFGKENDGLDVSWYHRDMGPEANAINIYDPDTLRSFAAVTVGDSFSQFAKMGYQYALSDRLGCTVANFRCYPDFGFLENYLTLLNNGYFAEGQTVILECVERNVISTFSRLDSPESFQDIPERDLSPDEEKSGTPFLNAFFSWIRLSLGYRNPIAHFTLTKACFTHDRFSRTLHVYNSERIGDGDMLWERNSDDASEKAAVNIKRIIDYSEKKGINLVLMIACDKYDAYEPWIKEAHQQNPTLERIPQDQRIYVTRDCLRDAIEKGTLDVYKLNNTHWSIVGADIVGNDLYGWMKERDFLPRI